jgi:hypothetical protein
MASNFKIKAQPAKNKAISLKITGDFDGSSALELVNTLGTYAKASNRILLDTAGLNEVWGFGRAVFEDACSDIQEIRSGATELVLSGEKLAI